MSLSLSWRAAQGRELRGILSSFLKAGAEKLRSKLGEKGEYIKTIWGMGYKFEVE